MLQDAEVKDAICVICCRKQKLKALYGNWVRCLFAADVGEYENAQKPSSRGPTPSNSFTTVRPPAEGEGVN